MFDDNPTATLSSARPTMPTSKSTSSRVITSGGATSTVFDIHALTADHNAIGGIAARELR